MSLRETFLVFEEQKRWPVSLHDQAQHSPARPKPGRLVCAPAGSGMSIMAQTARNSETNMRSKTKSNRSGGAMPWAENIAPNAWLGPMVNLVLQGEPTNESTSHHVYFNCVFRIENV